MLVSLRPSSESLLRARAPGARDQRGCRSSPFHRAAFVSKGDDPDYLRLHSFEMTDSLC